MARVSKTLTTPGFEGKAFTLERIAALSFIDNAEGVGRAYNETSAWHAHSAPLLLPGRHLGASAGCVDSVVGRL